MKTFRKILTYGVIVGIALLNALSYQLFVFPNKFAPSGINGICTMVQHVFGFNVGYLNLLINVPLAFWVLRKVGKSMAGRGMLYVGSFSLALIVLGQVDLSRFAYETANGTSRIIGPLVAGVINGYCYALLVRLNSCTGGVDYIAAVIHKYRPDQNFFSLIFAMNVAIAVVSYFVYDYQMEPVILCVLYSFMSSTVSDRMMKSGRSAIRFEIVTDHPNELSRLIIERIHHSATLIPGKGMYRGKETSILICVVNKSQMAALSAIIRKFPNTFAVVSNVSEVMGYFRRLDDKGNEEIDFLDQGDGKGI